jgi:hypothetical protein
MVKEKSINLKCNCGGQAHELKFFALEGGRKVLAHVGFECESCKKVSVHEPVSEDSLGKFGEAWRRFKSQ